MCQQISFHKRAWLQLAVAVLLSIRTARADSLKLTGGGTVEGRVLALLTESRGKTITVETRTGARITLARDCVSCIKRHSSPVRNSFNEQIRKITSPLTRAQQGWLPRVRSLVSRAFDSGGSRGRKARSELSAIVDTDAVPALRQSLQNHPLGDARQLYVAILSQIPGSESTGLLVSQSLYDQSQEVRALARRAIVPERAEAARPMYIAVLRSGGFDAAGRAALGLEEIGDPRGQSVPFLIDALIYEGTQTAMTERAPSVVTLTWCQDELRESLSPKFTSVPTIEGRPEVLQALLKIVDQPFPMFGYDGDRWRRWWANEKVNRDRTKSLEGPQRGRE